MITITPLLDDISHDVPHNVIVNDRFDQNYILKHEIEMCPKCFPKSAKYEIVFSVLFIDFQKCFQREWFSESRGGRVFYFD